MQFGVGRACAVLSTARKSVYVGHPPAFLQTSCSAPIRRQFSLLCIHAHICSIAARARLLLPSPYFRSFSSLHANLYAVLRKNAFFHAFNALSQRTIRRSALGSVAIALENGHLSAPRLLIIVKCLFGQVPVHKSRQRHAKIMTRVVAGQLYLIPSLSRTSL